MLNRIDIDISATMCVGTYFVINNTWLDNKIRNVYIKKKKIIILKYTRVTRGGTCTRA